jgi:RHS repeat-associated protein
LPLCIAFLQTEPRADRNCVLDQYTSVAGTAYTYDDNGNLAFDGQFRYYYDCESRLTDINDANDAPVASYAYDYLGRRISRTIYGSPDVTIQYAYDGDRIIAEYDANDVLLRKFIYGPGIDEPICLIEVADNNAVYYYHFDGLGSVVALSDVNSVLVERYTYDVFGRPAIRDANGTEIAASAFANPYLFTGRAYDAETGLYYYRARYYDYATARFLQPDPIGYADGVNLYTYVGNNPLSWTDPFGLCKEEAGKEGIPTWKKVLVGAGLGALLGVAAVDDLFGLTFDDIIAGEALGAYLIWIAEGGGNQVLSRTWRDLPHDVFGDLPRYERQNFSKWLETRKRNEGYPPNWEPPTDDEWRDWREDWENEGRPSGGSQPRGSDDRRRR